MTGITAPPIKKHYYFYSLAGYGKTRCCLRSSVNDPENSAGAHADSSVDAGALRDRFHIVKMDKGVTCLARSSEMPQGT